MGKILPSFRKAIIDDIVGSVTSNNTTYYAFGANPIAYVGAVPNVANDDYSTYFTNNWKMIFGKKLTNINFEPVIAKNIWSTNTVYSRYDNTSNTLYLNNDYYVISSPTIVGGSYYVYKCIDNNQNAVSTIDPGSIGTPTQVTTFETSDGYKWRYVASVSSANFDKFATDDYIPVYPDPSVVSTANLYAGVEVVVISNPGSGYNTYANGVVKSNPNSTIIQISDSSSPSSDFYNKNGVYIKNISAATSQLRNVEDYVANSSGRWIYLDEPANTTNIIPDLTEYIISPRIFFETDGDSQPKAYSTVNPIGNSIASVIILDAGSNISWANVSVISNPSFGSGANLYAIVPPPGGHGIDPATELNTKGLAINFSFSNTESNTILTSNVNYNKIGIIKAPYSLTANNTKGSVYVANTFDQTLFANVSPSFTFNVGETVKGVNSGAVGIVAFSNSTTVRLVGDMSFIDGEYVSNTNGNQVTTLAINSLGDIYTKDLKPIYVENINNVNRLNNQTETFKLVIQI